MEHFPVPCLILPEGIKTNHSDHVIWVNYNDLTVLPNPGIMVFNKGNHLQMAARFRLVKYYNLPRCNGYRLGCSHYAISVSDHGRYTPDVEDEWTWWYTFCSLSTTFLYNSKWPWKKWRTCFDKSHGVQTRWKRAWYTICVSMCLDIDFKFDIPFDVLFLQKIIHLLFLIGSFDFFFATHPIFFPGPTGLFPGSYAAAQGRTAAGSCTGHHSIAEILQAAWRDHQRSPSLKALTIH